jgi:hypothetical protein
MFFFKKENIQLAKLKGSWQTKIILNTIGATFNYSYTKCNLNKF